MRTPRGTRFPATWTPDEPVRDHNGHVVWRVRVGPGEMTCLGCGETFGRQQRCPVCTLDEAGKRTDVRPPAVETLSYLREGEWEQV